MKLSLFFGKKTTQTKYGKNVLAIKSGEERRKIVKKIMFFYQIRSN